MEMKTEIQREIKKCKQLQIEKYQEEKVIWRECLQAPPVPVCLVTNYTHWTPMHSPPVLLPVKYLNILIIEYLLSTTYSSDALLLS